MLVKKVGSKSWLAGEKSTTRKTRSAQENNAGFSERTDRGVREMGKEKGEGCSGTRKENGVETNIDDKTEAPGGKTQRLQEGGLPPAEAERRGNAEGTSPTR